MITRQWGFPRLWRPSAPGSGMQCQTMGPTGYWRRGSLIVGGAQPLMLPPAGPDGQLMPGYGYAMDPSDPKTWRQPVRWT